MGKVANYVGKLFLKALRYKFTYNVDSMMYSPGPFYGAETSDAMLDILEGESQGDKERTSDGASNLTRILLKRRLL